VVVVYPAYSDDFKKVKREAEAAKKAKTAFQAGRCRFTISKSGAYTRGCLGE
jgi:hypothetical protein